MARKVAAEKTTRINREPVAPAGIEKYCRGLDTWPRSWMGLEEDIPPGERLIECFRPFIEYLAASEKSRRTIQEHVDNMWVLGGEFISELKLLALFRPFPESLVTSALTPKTIRKHVDNMWLLAGEFIRNLHNDPSLRKKPVDPVITASASA